MDCMSIFYPHIDRLGLIVVYLLKGFARIVHPEEVQIEQDVLPAPLGSKNAAQHGLIHLFYN